MLRGEITSPSTPIRSAKMLNVAWHLGEFVALYVSLSTRLAADKMMELMALRERNARVIPLGQIPGICQAMMAL